MVTFLFVLPLYFLNAQRCCEIENDRQSVDRIILNRIPYVKYP